MTLFLALILLGAVGWATNDLRPMLFAVLLATLAARQEEHRGD